MKEVDYLSVDIDEDYEDELPESMLQHILENFENVLNKYDLSSKTFQDYMDEDYGEEKTLPKEIMDMLFNHIHYVIEYLPNRLPEDYDINARYLVYRFGDFDEAYLDNYNRQPRAVVQLDDSDEGYESE
jgi:hypothetical protein